jgi:DNA-binding SARP family transcriptional activator
VQDAQQPRVQRVEGRRLTIGILGPVEAIAGRRAISLGGSKGRALLSILVLHVNETVSTDRLIEGLWGTDPPPTAPKMLQVQVSRLRRALEPYEVLATRPSGYVLRAAPDQVDLLRFEAQVAAARRIPSTEPGRAADALREALRLWRGAPLSDVAGEPFATWAVPRLDELRLGVIEERIDLDLWAGRHQAVVAELRDLVTRHPFRERFVGQLMLALYRTGRQADALDVFRRNREVLADELGIEPGPALQQLQLAVLRQDPGLDATSPVDTGPPSIGRARAEEPVASAEPEAPASTRSIRTRTTTAIQLTGLLAVASLVGLGLMASSGRLEAVPPTPGTGTVVAAPDSVAGFDPVANELVDDISVGHAPGPLAAMDGSLWVGSGDDRTVSQIELATNRVVHTNGLASSPTTLVAADGSVWIGNGFSGTLSRILTAYDQLSAPFFPDKVVAGLVAVAAAHGDLWVGLGDQSLLRMDASSLHVQLTVPMSDRVQGITTSDGAAWTIQFRDHLVHRIDRASGAVSPGLSLDGDSLAIAFGHGSVWVATGSPDRVWQIDPIRDVVAASYPLPFTPCALVVDSDAVWAVDGVHGVLERLDPAGRALPTSVTVGRPVAGAALADGRLWLTIR